MTETQAQVDFDNDAAADLDEAAWPDTDAEHTSPDTAVSEDESVYTEDYLETIKKMPLPAVDSVDDFDPEEFMREYRSKRNAYNHIPADPDNDVDKPFLELEEIDDTSHADVTLDEPVQNDEQSAAQFSEQNQAVTAKRNNRFSMSDYVTPENDTDDDEDMTDTFVQSVPKNKQKRRSPPCAYYRFNMACRNMRFVLRILFV